ncbi:hypothetical protein [Clostridium tyrobutyricum]|uniref:hypothetical protein n=1 Tax=Clostridium tyrobutyricum TaxID=1519 RepID=UPI001C395616|nr:hypothetical protein [Clostridium tyrobutyricum]MBV4422934.1 hypothetical protein [Clostridium tyrobutyricum]
MEDKDINWKEKFVYEYIDKEIDANKVLEAIKQFASEIKRLSQDKLNVKINEANKIINLFDEIEINWDVNKIGFTLANHAKNRQAILTVVNSIYKGYTINLIENNKSLNSRSIDIGLDHGYDFYVDKMFKFLLIRKW